MTRENSTDTERVRKGPLFVVHLTRRHRRAHSECCSCGCFTCRVLL